MGIFNHSESCSSDPTQTSAGNKQSASGCGCFVVIALFIWFCVAINNNSEKSGTEQPMTKVSTNSSTFVDEKPEKSGPKEIGAAEQWMWAKQAVERKFPNYDIKFHWTTYQYEKETLNEGYSMHKEKFTIKGLPEVHSYIAHVNRETGEVHRLVIDGEVIYDFFDWSSQKK